jgi:glycosyltransferase involved in cell wall biosynthesis
MNLVLFTSTYPFDGGAEQTFLNPELEYLRSVFDRIVLVPKKILGNCLPLPENVSVDKSYALLLDHYSSVSLLGRVLGSRLFYREFFSHPSLLLYPSAVMRMTRFMAVAKLTFDWVKNWLDGNPECRTLFYTYWFDSSSLGIGLAKQHDPRLRLISRVHGYDLYEEDYYNPPYWPFRLASIAVLEALFPDSDAGLQYLTEKYPQHSAHYQTSLLGVADPGFVSLASADNVFRIVSCSMLVPVKRVELLLEGVLCASQMRKHQKFEWTHMGNGSTRNELQKNADRVLPENAKAFFPGYSDKSALMKFYKERPADVFINVSSTEGTPVSVMEAASCSIPVIATAVGGNPEIVSERNGILLDRNPAPREIAEAIFDLIDHPEAAAQKRKESRAVWTERYNAEVNFRAFAERLRFIGET